MRDKEECTNSDLWNCKYCDKTATCKALDDPMNFGPPAYKNEFLQVLSELIHLVDSIVSGEYTPDSLTTQPAKELLAKIIDNDLVLAPLYPTDAMVTAGVEHENFESRVIVRDIYKAMMKAREQ
jgi:hypothetical protein